MCRRVRCEEEATGGPVPRGVQPGVKLKELCSRWVGGVKRWVTFCRGCLESVFLAAAH